MSECVPDFLQWVSCDSAHRVYECVGVQEGALLEWEEKPCEDQRHSDASSLLTSCCRLWPLRLPVFFSEYCRTHNVLQKCFTHQHYNNVHKLLHHTIKTSEEAKKLRWITRNSCLWGLKWKWGSVPLNEIPLYKHNRLWISPGKRTVLSIKESARESRIKSKIVCLSVSQSGSCFFYTINSFSLQNGCFHFDLAAFWDHFCGSNRDFAADWSFCSTAGCDFNLAPSTKKYCLFVSGKTWSMGLIKKD